MQFVKKTSSRSKILGIIIKLSFFIAIFIGIIFLLNKVDFPTPKKKN